MVAASSCLLLLAGAWTALADFQTAVFPIARDLSSNGSLVKIAWDNALRELQQLAPDSRDESPHRLQDCTVSLGVFSVHDSQVAETFQFHHTGDNVKKSRYGTKKVDADSMYYIGSVSKVFTVLAGLINLDNADWTRPVTDFFPVLKQHSEERLRRQQEGQESDDDITKIKWEEITLEAMASQMSGMPRDELPVVVNDLLYKFYLERADILPTNENAPEMLGLPENGFPGSKIAKYFSNDTKTIYDKFIASPSLDILLDLVVDRRPIFDTWLSSSYSNINFILLGFILQQVKNQTFEEIIQQDIIQPLGMQHATSRPLYLSPDHYKGKEDRRTPEEKERDAYDLAHTVIPTVNPINEFNNSPLVGPTGGIRSSLRDMTRFGLGILESKLLPPSETRRWFRPLAFTGDASLLIGLPWEIVHYVDPITQISTRAYTKSGSTGLSKTLLVLLPQYDVGFTVFFADAKFDNARSIGQIVDTIVDNIVPALQAQAAVETEKLFSGRYVAKHGDDTSSDKSSAILLSVQSDPKKTNNPGLKVLEWSHQGINYLDLPFYKGVVDQYNRLLPTLQAKSGSNKRVFRLTTNPGHWFTDDNKPVTGYRQLRGVHDNAMDFYAVDNIRYDSTSLELFEFEVDPATGQALRVYIPHTHTVLERVTDGDGKPLRQPARDEL